MDTNKPVQDDKDSTGQTNIGFLSEDYIKNIEESLLKYEKDTLGLSYIKFEAPECLMMKISELRNKTPEILAEYSLELHRYALYIQQTVNKNKSWERWAKSKLNEVAAYYLVEIDSHYGFNERELIAKNNNDHARKLNKFLRNIQMRIDRLYNLSNNISAIADSIKDLRFAATNREKYRS
ncbi:MAG: hypothetical protein BAJALOKI3v1_50093 [Promethearchaeota archaeon]|nr:MAG: hypothetical protein BAJALOKI3v1_50093 [Candidatus Lokiarchaeota archaeon]